jgi:hypothetical protein
MSSASRSALIRNAAVAATVGSMVGGAAGLWSVRHPAAAIPIAAPAPDHAVARDTSTSPKPVGIAGSLQPPPQSQSRAPIPQPAERHAKTVDRHTVDVATAPVRAAVTQAQPAAATKDDGDVVGRARALARRADVAALLALREGVVRRAAEHGVADSPALKAELAELDQRLDEARLLRLKLDGEDLRNSKQPR